MIYGQANDLMLKLILEQEHKS